MQLGWSFRLKMSDGEQSLLWVTHTSVKLQCFGQMSGSNFVQYTVNTMYWLDDCMVTGAAGWVSDCCTVGGRAEIIHKHTLMPKHTQLTVQLLPCGWETATSHDCQLLSGPVFIINTSVTEWETERTHDDGDDGGDSLWFTASLLLESKVHLIQ